MIEFALDPPLPETVGQIVGTLQSRQELDWFALLDTAFDHEKPGFSTPSDAVNCFEGVIFLDDLKKVAPVLIPLPSPHALERVKALVRHRAERPMLSFFGAEKGFSAGDFREQWEALHWIKPEDGGRFLLRMADTRTIGILPKFLEAEQWQAIHLNIVQWQIIGRSGKYEEVLLGKTDKSLPFELKVTEKQFARMMELAEPDEALSAIHRQQINVFPEEMTGWQFYDIAVRMLHKTAQYDITHWDDRVSLIILSIGTNGEMVDDPDVNDWMKAKEWEEGRIGHVLSSLPCLDRWR